LLNYYSKLAVVQFQLTLHNYTQLWYTKHQTKHQAESSP